MPASLDERFSGWMRDLESRHLSALEFREVTRAIRALSASYVERRERLARAGPLDSAGKRAAFAIYYGPLHFLLAAEIVRALGAARKPVRTVLDVGCGTGAAGAAWAASLAPPAQVLGVDRHPWALTEAAQTYRAFGLRSRLVKGQASGFRPPRPDTGIVAAFVANELSTGERARLRTRLLAAAEHGAAVLVIEPIARSLTSWWNAWREAFATHAGRADEWRLPVALPPVLAKFDRSAGLTHNELTARTLWIPPRVGAHSPRNR